MRTRAVHPPVAALRDGRRAGQVLVAIAVMLPALFGFAALVVDVGYLYVVKSVLQRTADASALAAVVELPAQTNVVTQAQAYATLNYPDHGTIVDVEDVVIGNWDGDGTFTPGGNPTNAVRVVAARLESRGNAVRLFFAPILGIPTADVRAYAVATAGVGQEAYTRFLIDEELIDSDIPVIEQLAEAYGMTPNEIISDNDGDWFIDLPPGEVLELPTGQVGDSGLWDITHDAFQFGESSSPSLNDFLNYNEDSSSWRYSLIPKSMLDPMLGVRPVNDPDEYPNYVDPEHCQVSPVFDSDISELNHLGDPYSEIPAANGLGWRRGLLAFKVIGIGEDPDGPNGSYLPNIIIEICPPSLGSGPGGLAEIVPYGDQYPRLVK